MKCSKCGRDKRVTLPLWMRIALAVILAALAAVLWWLSPVDFAGAEEPDDFCCILWVGDSLKEIVQDSEGGRMPSREEFDRRRGENDAGHDPGPMKEGESPAGVESDTPATPPRAPDAGGPGRVLTMPAVWGFVEWGGDGKRIGGRLRDTRDECESLLAEHRAQHPDWVFSPCVWVRVERETL